MTREELELLTDISDFTSVFCVILRLESSEPNNNYSMSPSWI